MTRRLNGSALCSRLSCEDVLITPEVTLISKLPRENMNVMLLNMQLCESYIGYINNDCHFHTQPMRHGFLVLFNCMIIPCLPAQLLPSFIMLFRHQMQVLVTSMVEGWRMGWPHQCRRSAEGLPIPLLTFQMLGDRIQGEGIFPFTL